MFKDQIIRIVTRKSYGRVLGFPKDHHEYTIAVLELLGRKAFTQNLIAKLKVFGFKFDISHDLEFEKRDYVEMGRLGGIAAKKARHEKEMREWGEEQRKLRESPEFKAKMKAIGERNLAERAKRQANLNIGDLI